MFRQKFLICLLASLVGWLALPAAAVACPTCKDGISENYVNAYAYSIMFMMATPYIILGAFATYLIYLSMTKRPVDAMATEELLVELARKKSEEGIPTQPPALDG